MMLYKNTKVKVCSPDGDTDFFDIVAGVLQGATLSSYLFCYLPRLRASNVDRFKENGFTLAKAKAEDKPARPITDADYADDSTSGKYTSPGAISAA